MKSVLSICIVGLVAIGCGQQATESQSADAKPAAAAAAPAAAAPMTTDTTAAPMTTDPSADSMTMAATEAASEMFTGEIACGHCVWHMEGVQSCNVAAKIGDQIVVVQAADFHDDGLCSGPKPATITGTLENGTLIATKIEVTP